MDRLYRAPANRLPVFRSRAWRPYSKTVRDRCRHDSGCAGVRRELSRRSNEQIEFTKLLTAELTRLGLKHPGRRSNDTPNHPRCPKLALRRGRRFIGAKVIVRRPMSALGQKRTFCGAKVMSALPPIADMCSALAPCPLCANSGHQLTATRPPSLA